MKLVFVGLGKMGSQIATKFIQAGHQVIAIDPNQDAVDMLVQKGAVPAKSRQEALENLNDEQPKIIWLMIPAGAVDEELSAWLDIVTPGSIIVDGGNSDYRLTTERSKRASEKQVNLMDVGTSGGIKGLENGFCMMVGGDKASYEIIQPLIDIMSKPHGGFEYFGDSGNGHYVKMVHNGIEYAIMQALAEGYNLLSDGPIQNIDLSSVASVWQKGSIIESKLNELVEQIYLSNPTLDGIDGSVGENGEGRWTLESAASKNIPMPALQSALDVRFLSRSGTVNHATKLLAAMRNAFGGHNIQGK